MTIDRRVSTSAGNRFHIMCTLFDPIRLGAVEDADDVPQLVLIPTLRMIPEAVFHTWSLGCAEEYIYHYCSHIPAAYKLRCAHQGTAEKRMPVFKGLALGLQAVNTRISVCL